MRSATSSRPIESRTSEPLAASLHTPKVLAVYEKDFPASRCAHNRIARASPSSAFLHLCAPASGLVSLPHLHREMVNIQLEVHRAVSQIGIYDSREILLGQEPLCPFPRYNFSANRIRDFVGDRAAHPQALLRSSVSSPSADEALLRLTRTSDDHSFPM